MTDDLETRLVNSEELRDQLEPFSLDAPTTHYQRRALVQREPFVARAASYPSRGFSESAVQTELCDAVALMRAVRGEHRDVTPAQPALVAQRRYTVPVEVAAEPIDPASRSRTRLRERVHHRWGVVSLACAAALLAALVALCAWYELGWMPRVPSQLRIGRVTPTFVAPPPLPNPPLPNPPARQH